MRKFVRGRVIALLVVGAAACGGGGGTATGPTTTTAITTTAAGPTSTSTVTVPPTTWPVSPGALRGDGIGPVLFGTAAEEAITALVRQLGPADGDDTIDSSRECVEGSSWKDCVPVVATGRVVSWSGLGLDVALSDCPSASGAPPVPLHLVAWHVKGPSALATTAGVHPGDTFGELESAYPSVELFSNEGVLDTIVVPAAGGPVVGLLLWPSYPDYVRAVQHALNEQGAELEVDGVWGQATDEAFARVFRVAGPDDVWRVLGLPPRSVPVAELHAGAAGACP